MKFIEKTLEEYAEETARECELLEKSRQETDEAADIYMNDIARGVLESTDLADLLDGIEEGTMVTVVIE